jgi:L-alanine-DL-glutamate epimerase-like enolase superfamily enzyme
VAPSLARHQEYFGEDRHPLLHTTPVLKNPPTVVDGFIAVPDGPGLGVEVDEEAVRKAADVVSAGH